jgi:hypothetical protein
MKNSKVKSSVIIIFTISFLGLTGASQVSAKFINTFLIKIGGGDFTGNEDTAKYLAQYDMIITRKMQSDDIGGYYGSTWKAIKKYNPNCKIHLYAKVSTTHPDHDSHNNYYSNNLARYNVSKGHSDGKLANHYGYFLHRNGKLWLHGNDGYLLDPGEIKFQAYSLEATLTDYNETAWSADGVYTDLLMSKISLFGWCDEYKSQEAWGNAVQSFINYLAKGLNSHGQAFSVNHGNTMETDTKNHWIALNALANPPDYLLEEGAHAVLYGAGDIQFPHEYRWKKQIDTMVALTNIGFLSGASTNLADINSTGTDNYGKAFTGWDALYFAMGSYCLGKDDNDAFFFRTAGSTGYSRWRYYYDEYDHIDLGAAIGKYSISSYGDKNIYWREFEKGYVFVNPTDANVHSIALPEPCKLRTHNNLYEEISTIQSVSTIRLNAHRAAFLYKSNNNSIMPPQNVRITN